MKKLFLLLAVCSLLGLAGCGRKCCNQVCPEETCELQEECCPVNRSAKEVGWDDNY